MSAWGEKPFANDLAADLLVDLVKTHVHRAANEKSRAKARSFYLTARAVVQFVLAAEEGVFLVACQEALLRMRGDAPWLKSWDDPAILKARLDEEILLVQAAMLRSRTRQAELERARTETATARTR